MRGDAKAREKRMKQICSPKLKKFSSIWGILYIVLLLALEGLLVYIDLLPIKYMCIALIALTVISLAIIPLLLFKNIKKNKKVPALIIATILMILYGVGIVYLGNTIGFFSNVFGAGGEKVDYDVLVSTDSTYEEIQEIEGKTIYTLPSVDATLSDAKATLEETVNISYEMANTDLSGLCNSLTDKTYEILLISHANYQMMCEKDETFESKSKILYTVSVNKIVKSTKDVDVTKESFNILISGNDTTGTIEDVAKSDVNMIMTVNPVTKKIRLTSIPRDYYVYVPGIDAYDKLTHTGNFGIDETAASLENLLGIDINYYVKVNFTCVIELVDAIGGIDVVSEYDFVTSGRQNNGYVFHVGKNHIDGKHALAFSRERHAFPTGDNQRIKNQQQVIEAMIKKCTKSSVVLTKYGSILGAVGDYMQTNMSQDNIKKLAKMQLNDMTGWKIKKQSLTGTGELTTVYSLGDLACYVMMPDQISVAEASDRIHRTMREVKE